MRLTDLDNGNDMYYATCAFTQTSLEWSYCPFTYCNITLYIPFSAVVLPKTKETPIHEGGKRGKGGDLHKEKMQFAIDVF